MPRNDNSPRQSTAIVLLWGGAVVASLFFARDVLLPFSLAVLFSFLVAPLVDRLERWRVPRVTAVLMVVLLGFAALGTFSYVVFSQVYDLAYRLPEFERNLTNKAKVFQGNGKGVLSHVASALDHVQRNLKTEAGEELAGANRPSSSDVTPPAAAWEPRVPELHGPATPIPVQIVETISPGAILPRIASWLAAPLGAGAVVIVLVIFMLLEREDLRNRLIHMIGAQQLNFTTQALDDAAHRVSRYLRMQLIINSVFGCVTAVGLWLIG